MAPSCRAMGPISNVNYIINHEGWLRSYKEDQPHVQFCGEVARRQLSKSRHFMAENPHPSWLLHEPPWPMVCQNPKVCIVTFDQCMLGLRHHRDKKLVKKPTMLVCSAEVLTEPFRNLKCNGRHEHSQAWGRGLDRLQVWPWNFAERIVQSIVLLKKWLRKAEPLYPVRDVGTAPGSPGDEVGPNSSDDPGPDEAGPNSSDEEPWWYRCPGCRGRKASTRREHTRVEGECKFPIRRR